MYGKRASAGALADNINKCAESADIDRFAVVAHKFHIVKCDERVIDVANATQFYRISKSTTIDTMIFRKISYICYI